MISLHSGFSTILYPPDPEPDGHGNIVMITTNPPRRHRIHLELHSLPSWKFLFPSGVVMVDRQAVKW